MLAGHDVLIVHTDTVGWFHASNAYLRYLCDWMREGVLIIPMRQDKELVLLSFFTQSVILPPGGEPVGVEQIWQVGAIGREYADRPGSSMAKTSRGGDEHPERAQACRRPDRTPCGDRTSVELFGYLDALMPKARFVSENADHRPHAEGPHHRARSPMSRAAAQLISIGTQAAYHVTRPGVTDDEIYAAFTFAQLARGGETGDGYQIGINQWGTHCGKPYGQVSAPGDLINLYISNVTYQGYTAQTARMIAMGEITDRQEKVLDACTEA